MTMTRYIKIVHSTANDKEIDSLENRVNDTVRRLALCGGRVVSFVPETFGLSPMKFFMIIIYEATEELTDEVIDRKLAEHDEN